VAGRDGPGLAAQTGSRDGGAGVSRKETTRRVDAIRAQRSELENHLIDEYSSGYINRREFVRRGGVIGMSIPLVSFLAAACGTGSKSGGGGGGGADTAVKAGGKQVAVKPGGTLKLGMSPGPSTEIDPIKVADEGGLGVMSQSGEFLAWSDSKLQLQPRLAESWKPNADGSVWTFKIRQGVKFHDGTPMTADDVAASINALSDPKNGSNALSTFAGVLSKDSAKATDASTVQFELDGPNGNFPYMLGSDNYNALIVPKDLKGSWEKTFPGTGPWKMEKYTPNSGISYVKNPDYWDKTRIPKLDRQQVKFYPKEQAQILGLQSGDVDVLVHFSPTGGKALLNDPNVTVIELRASVHREIHMRNDKKPFDDKLVRQAMALAVDRPALVNGLMAGKSDFGNDSPFAPVFPSTDKSVAQRKQDLAKAKALMQQAGVSNASVTIDTWDGFELPDLAQLLQNDAAKIGLTLKPNVTPAGTYYGDAVFGKSPWLDSTMGITDYGHRGVPNVFLAAQLSSKGVWNAAHFKNETYDGLMKDYVAALDLQSQRTAAAKIQNLLLDETPNIYAYFYYFLTATKKNVGNVEVSAMGHYDITKAGFTSAA
jgi:peptide/nickel transport system substrate-binding protein